MEKILIPKDKWQALKQFRSADKSAEGTAREALSGVYIDAKRIVACDGRALLSIPRDIVSAPECCNGSAWKVISEIKHNKIFMELVLDKLSGEYPDIDCVIPAAMPKADRLKMVLRDDKKHIYFDGSAPIYLYKFTGGGFRDDILKRLLPIGAVWSVSKAAEDSQLKPIRLETSDGCLAVIMPFELRYNQIPE